MNRVRLLILSLVVIQVSLFAAEKAATWEGDACG